MRQLKSRHGELRYNGTCRNWPYQSINLNHYIQETPKFGIHINPRNSIRLISKDRMHVMVNNVSIVNTHNQWILKKPWEILDIEKLWHVWCFQIMGRVWYFWMSGLWEADLIKTIVILKTLKLWHIWSLNLFYQSSKQRTL